MLMPAREAIYFHNAPLAHVVAYEDKQRVDRIYRRACQLIERRTGSRAR